MEMDDNGFSLVYRIFIYFELKKIKWEKNTIINKVKEILVIMNIKIGNLIDEPIVIMYYHKYATCDMWNNQTLY